MRLTATTDIELPRLCFGDEAIAYEFREHEFQAELPFTARDLSTRVQHEIPAGLVR